MLTTLLDPGSRWTLVGGKGGVGKTTVAAALSLELAAAGERVLCLSVDPAHSLGDALGVELGAEPAAVPGAPGLEAMEVDAARERDRFLDRRRGALLRLVERGTYLEGDDVEGLADLALPGMDELAALFRLLELADDSSRRLVVDTAPTGHTLRLLDLPRVARQWLAALEAMEEKHRAVALALAGGYRPDEAGALLRELDADLAGLSALLADPSRARFVLVTTTDPVVLAETRRYRAELEGRGVALGGIVVNRSSREVPAGATGRGMVFVPPLRPDPRGPMGLRRFAASATTAPPEGGRVVDDGAGAAADLVVDGAFLPPTDRSLYLVGGKGGVGKSTAAAALALRLGADGGRRVLLLSVDPAGSLSEVLGGTVGGTAAPVPDAPGVWARQLDAPEIWARFRDEYRRETERLFSGLLSRGLSASADERVVRRLIDLAPPGVDELVALLEVIDATEDRPYDALVLDTAPTGHLLRLLEMPGVALGWTHALLRLLLKYREAVPLGDLAERVLRLSRALRALRERLADPGRTWFLAVALPESLGVPETSRLFARLRSLGIEPGALLVNRLLDARSGAVADADAARSTRALLEIGAGVPCAGAPRLAEGPAGAEALRSFLDGWRRISSRSHPRSGRTAGGDESGTERPGA